MNSIQLEFDIFDSELSILDICNKCIKECKIYISILLFRK